MNRLGPVFLVLGMALVALGLLWTMQGLGWIRWPESSFMIGRQDWVLRGALTALVGAILVWRNWRR